MPQTAATKPLVDVVDIVYEPTMSAWRERIEVSAGVHLTKCHSDDVEALRALGSQTYRDAFASMNSPETMEHYLEHAFRIETLLAELATPESAFYFLTASGSVAGYLKLNEPPAQTDLNEPGF